MPVLASRGAASLTGFGGLAKLGYLLRNSLRFRSASNAYLNRTPASAGNRKTFTYSFWMKYGISSQYSVLFSALNSGGTDQDALYIDNTSYAQAMSVRLDNGAFLAFATTQAFRDPAAWYHVVMAMDTTQATAANRLKLYINGSEVTSFQVDGRSSITQNSDMNCWNRNGLHLIGSQAQSAPAYTHNGYFAEINFVDGLQLTPSSFAKTDPVTGQWIPKKYSGAYGTNGFYLNFNDTSNTTAATLGKDSSGNGNNWTPNNFSITAGVTYDPVTDVPTLTSATAANYATFNPVIPSNFTLSNGNLNVAGTSEVGAAISTIGMSSGKWYWESTGLTGSNGNHAFGICNSTALGKSEPNGTAGFWVTNGINGNKYANGGAGAAYMSSYTNNDVIGIAFDADAGTVVYYKNGVSQGTAFTGLTSGPYFAINGYESGAAFTSCINFGQRGFAYTAPSGFKALNTFNLP
jgi:hypothetical protein